MTNRAYSSTIAGVDDASSVTESELVPTDEPGQGLEGLDDEEIYPVVVGCDTPADELGARWVDYSDRGPRDVVVSGPVTGGHGPGRWHRNRRVAYWRMVDKYGADRVKQTRQSEGRWSFLIKNLRLPVGEPGTPGEAK